MNKCKYRVDTKFVFNGMFEIEAESSEEAKRKVLESCGMTGNGKIHTSLPYDEVEWDFENHPEKEIVSVTCI